MNYLANLTAEFASSDDCLLRVGLTRPYTPEGADTACWLQITNMFARPRAHF